MSTPEGLVKAMIKRRVNREWPSAYGFMPVQNGMGAPALDFFWCILGLFVAIEAKDFGKKPTPRQEVTADHIKIAGGLAFVVDGEASMDTAIATIKLILHSKGAAHDRTSGPAEATSNAAYQGQTK